MSDKFYRDGNVEEIWRIASEIPRSAYLDAIDNARKHRHDFEGAVAGNIIGLVGLRDVYSGRMVVR